MCLYNLPKVVSRQNNGQVTNPRPQSLV